MKVLLYSEGLNFIKNSGLGRAIEHQKTALTSVGITYTTDPNDSYDLVHINTYFPKSILLAKKMKRRGIPVVYHAHSTEEDFRNSFVFSNTMAPLFKKWIVSCYNLGDVVVTPTPYSKQLLEKAGVKPPIFAISNGIDLTYYEVAPQMRQAFRDKYHFSPQDKVVMAVGHYIKRKGILDFVELAKQMPEYQFVWFGYTNLMEVPKDVQAAVKTELPNLIFAGFVSRGELRNAYAGADLFMFPTYEETEGIVLLEALAMKQNVLVRDIPIYAEYEEGKHVYKGRNIGEFASVIRDLFSGRLPALVDQAYAEVEKRDIRRVGPQLAALYSQLLPPKG